MLLQVGECDTEKMISFPLPTSHRVFFASFSGTTRSFCIYKGLINNDVSVLGRRPHAVAFGLKVEGRDIESVS